MKFLIKLKSLKSINFFLTLVVLSLSLNFSFISNSHSFNICSTNDDGAIIVKDDGDGDITSFALASSPSLFNFGGNTDSCDITPDHYKIKIYRMGICTENPYRAPDSTHTNTVNADLSSCVTLYSNDTGKELDITPGSEQDLLDGTLLLPIGSYKYPYIVADNHIHLKHIQKFINSDGTDALVKGYHGSSQDKFTNRGTVCYTGKDDSGNIWINTHTFELQAASATPAYTTLHGTTLPTDFTGTPNHTRYRCGTLSAAQSGNDWTTTIINSFGNRLWQSSSSVDTTQFRNATGCCNTHASVPGIEQTFYLLKTDNETIADTQENARRILLIQIHDDPIVVSEQTVGFKLNFKTNNAINVRIYQEADQGTENRDELLMGTRMIANEIYLNIQTKTKRSRGTWR